MVSPIKSFISHPANCRQSTCPLLVTWAPMRVMAHGEGGWGFAMTGKHRGEPCRHNKAGCALAGAPQHRLGRTIGPRVECQLCSYLEVFVAWVVADLLEEAEEGVLWALEHLGTQQESP